MRKISVEISYKTILFTLTLVLGTWLLYQIKDILFLLFVCLVLVGALNPIVTKIEKRGVPRWLAISLLYLALLLIFVGILAGILPLLTQQTSEFVRAFPDIIQKLSFIPLSADSISSQFGDLLVLPSGILRFTVSLFSNALSLAAILVISFYLLLEHRNLDDYLLDLFGEEGGEKGKNIIRKLEESLGGWVRAEALLMIFVGVISYIGFLFLGLDFALALGLLAGLLEIVPNIGPLVAAIPAVLVGFLASPLIGLATASWCILVQQIENNFLVPRVMNQLVGVNPVITLLSLAIGLRLAGAGGAVLAVPVYLTVRILLNELVFSSEKQLK